MRTPADLDDDRRPGPPVASPRGQPHRIGKRGVAAHADAPAGNRSRQRGGHVEHVEAREVDSVYIGELVMQELKRLDKIAYIRFASVYKNFEDLAEFQEAIAEVGQPRK